jgi:large subunit ribosomal protein L21
MPQSQREVITDIDLEAVKKTVSDLSNLTVKNLKDLAKERGISGYTTKKKMEVIKLLS